MNDFVRALKEGTAYDYVLNNGDELKHKELIICLRECLYNMDKDQLALVSGAVCAMLEGDCYDDDEI